MANHSIVHIELPSINSKEDAQFYNDAFGWATNSMPSGASDYYMYTPIEGPGGGFNPVGDGADNNLPIKPGEVIVYVSTDDINESLARIESLGGKTIMPKSPIPGMGWMALFTDPTGNRVGLYTNDANAG